VCARVHAPVRSPATRRPDAIRSVVASASGLRAAFDATATTSAAAPSGDPPRLLPSQLGAATEHAYGVYLVDSHAAALLAESKLAPDAPLGLEARGSGS